MRLLFCSVLEFGRYEDLRVVTTQNSRLSYGYGSNFNIMTYQFIPMLCGLSRVSWPGPVYPAYPRSLFQYTPLLVWEYSCTYVCYLLLHVR